MLCELNGGVLTALAIFTVLGASLLCPSNAFASVRMYVIWQPVQNGGWQRADGGSTIGGVFHVRVVVQPNSGYLYGGAFVISNSVTELADHHAGQTTMGNFAQVSPNSSFGDPTSNVSVLQSEPLFLPHNATYRLWVRVHYLTY
ncbi:MAG: hypothetical protein HPY54_16515, partial [Chthonomonadetes bacterium]|nr:hypothetical protein [Chthonomonadetes bacterium]